MSLRTNAGNAFLVSWTLYRERLQLQVLMTRLLAWAVLLKLFMTVLAQLRLATCVMWQEFRAFSLLEVVMAVTLRTLVPESSRGPARAGNLLSRGTGHAMVEVHLHPADAAHGMHFRDMHHEAPLSDQIETLAAVWTRPRGNGGLGLGWHPPA